MTDSPPTKENWHLDKRVPISLIVTIFLQTAFVVWFVAGLAKDVENLDQRTDRIENRNTVTEATVSANTTSIAVFNESINSLRNQNERILEAIQRLEDKIDENHSN